jgi:hypothetical protein
LRAHSLQERGEPSRSGRGEPSPGADVGEVSPAPVQTACRRTAETAVNERVAGSADDVRVRRRMLRVCLRQRQLHDLEPSKAGRLRPPAHAWGTREPATQGTHASAVRYDGPSLTPNDTTPRVPTSAPGLRSPLPTSAPGLDPRVDRRPPRSNRRRRGTGRTSAGNRALCDASEDSPGRGAAVSVEVARGAVERGRRVRAWP